MWKCSRGSNKKNLNKIPLIRIRTVLRAPLLQIVFQLVSRYSGVLQPAPATLCRSGRLSDAAATSRWRSFLGGQERLARSALHALILHRLDKRMSISALWGLLPLTHQSVFVTGLRVLLISRLSVTEAVGHVLQRLKLLMRWKLKMCTVQTTRKEEIHGETSLTCLFRPTWHKSSFLKNVVDALGSSVRCDKTHHKQFTRRNERF